jgi:hypothetical protein
VFFSTNEEDPVLNANLNRSQEVLKCFEWKQCNIALHGVAHVDAIDACLVLCSMDTHGTHCDQVMKTGAFSVAKSLAEFQCRKLRHVSKWGIPFFFQNEGEI